MSQYCLSGRTSFLIARCLLGLLEGGFIPDVVLYLSYYYTKRERKSNFRGIFLIYLNPFLFFYFVFVFFCFVCCSSRSLNLIINILCFPFFTVIFIFIFLGGSVPAHTSSLFSHFPSHPLSPLFFSHRRQPN